MTMAAWGSGLVMNIRIRPRELVDDDDDDEEEEEEEEEYTRPSRLDRGMSRTYGVSGRMPTRQCSYVTARPSQRE
jgi:hypothetical protein